VGNRHPKVLNRPLAKENDAMRKNKIANSLMLEWAIALSLPSNSSHAIQWGKFPLKGKFLLEWKPFPVGVEAFPVGVEALAGQR